MCKPWVFIEGSGSDVTTIRSRGGVTGASDSSIGSVTIDAGPTAITCVGAVNFDTVGNCIVIASDSAERQVNNYLGVSADFSAKGNNPSVLSIGYSTIQARTSDTLSITAAVVAAANAVVLLNYCPKITATGGSTNMGCAAATAAEIQLYDCSGAAAQWKPDPASASPSPPSRSRAACADAPGPSVAVGTEEHERRSRAAVTTVAVTARSMFLVAGTSLHRRTVVVVVGA